MVNRYDDRVRRQQGMWGEQFGEDIGTRIHRDMVGQNLDLESRYGYQGGQPFRQGNVHPGRYDRDWAARNLTRDDYTGLETIYNLYGQIYPPREDIYARSRTQSMGFEGWQRGYGAREYGYGFDPRLPHGSSEEGLAHTAEPDARGPHKGRGPKGYQRSDARIYEDVSDRLTADPELDASAIEVKVANGEVWLTGAVPNRFSKRRAGDLADEVAGVKDVHNELYLEQSAMMQGYQARTEHADQVGGGTTNDQNRASGGATTGTNRPQA